MTIVEMLDTFVGQDAGRITRSILMGHLKDTTKTHMGVRACREITDNGVKSVSSDGKKTEIVCDDVLISIGDKALNKSYASD